MTLRSTGLNTLFSITQTKVSIIIPNKDSADVLRKCVNSLLAKSSWINYEILVIENNSVKQETFAYYDSMKDISKVRLLTYTFTGAFNYSDINNWAATQANGEHLLFLNNDTEVIAENWLEEMLMFSQREDIGAVGAMLYYPNDTIQHAGVAFDRVGGVARHLFSGMPRVHGGYMGRLLYPSNVSAVTGACMMVEKRKFNHVLGFDPAYALAFGDVDICVKLLAVGYLNVFTPYAELYHYESYTRGYEDTPEKQSRFDREVAIFRSSWGEWVDRGDPYWNDNAPNA